ncbi:MAG: ABC transporter permease [Chloroflexota bacterium]|nr:ABC transporter permease [Chloroflexota bacterium]
MYRFLLARAIKLIYVLVGSTFVIFIAGYYAPGDPIRALFGGHGVNSVLYQQRRHIYGFDLPWWQQYIHYVINCLHGNFGLSYHTVQQPVWEIVAPGLPASGALALEALAASMLIGIPAGISVALRSETRAASTITRVVFLLSALPGIVLIVSFQMLMVWLYKWGVRPLPMNDWQVHVVPVLLIAIMGGGLFYRLARTSMLETLKCDDVRTARAKGLQERTVLLRHALPGALIPLLSALGPALGLIVTSVLITEYLLHIPGLSATLLNAINLRDYPVAQAIVVISCFFIVTCTLLSDIVATFVDPYARMHDDRRNMRPPYRELRPLF